MAFPSSGFIFQVPVEDRSVFSDEPLLKIKNIKLQTNSGDLSITALTPKGKSISATIKGSDFYRILKKKTEQC